MKIRLGRWMAGVLGLGLMVRQRWRRQDPRARYDALIDALNQWRAEATRVAFALQAQKWSEMEASLCASALNVPAGIAWIGEGGFGSIAADLAQALFESASFQGAGIIGPDNVRHPAASCGAIKHYLPAEDFRLALVASLGIATELSRMLRRPGSSDAAAIRARLRQQRKG